MRSFSTAPLLVARTDLVLTAPSSMVKVTRAMNIIDRAPPLPLPGHGIAMLWHQRFAQEPDLIWLREQVSEVSRLSNLG